MTQIEGLWSRLEAGGPGGATRVDETHPADLYAALDAQGDPGLLLLSSGEPPEAPRLDAVEVLRNLRQDGRWAMGIWLREPELRTLFAQLCADLIESSRAIRVSSVPAHILGRLVLWRELLERAAGPMPMSKLRGLVGELLVMERCLHQWSLSDVIAGWVGPVGGPQDYVLPGLRVEVKTNFASGRVVQITSIDQLDTDEHLTLAVVTLTTLAGGEGLAPNDLVESLDERFLAAGGELVSLFRKRLTILGYRPDPTYRSAMFRLDGIEYFDVRGDFPRLRRDALPAGVEKVAYDISLGACAPYRSSLRR